MAKRPELFVAGGELDGKSFAVKEGGLRLGRSSQNDIHVPDEELSRNHCLFEPFGEVGIRLTDLASANGTFLNGKSVGVEPVELREGDVVRAGKLVIRVGANAKVAASDAQPTSIDLGLGAKPGETNASAPKAPRRSPLANVLWGVAVLSAVVAICCVLTAPKSAVETAPKPIAEQEPAVAEVYYEKVDANTEGIFRYALSFTPDRVLTVKIDDVPKENRHHVKSKPLAAEAVAELSKIVSYKTLREIDREYVGVEPDTPALQSWTLRVIYDTRARSVRVVNTQEPEAFRAVREKLEAFSKSELGVWAIQYSRDKLIALAEDAVRLGQAKWTDRDVAYGNLAAAIAAYNEAIFYLETVNPKPPCHATATEGLAQAKAELDTRYADQRFRADRALNLAQWETAQAELKVLLEMVPDRRDDRNRDATSKLLSAEGHLKKGGR